MIASACFPVLLYVLESPPEPVLWSIIAVAALIVLKHRPNMENLVKGTEPRIGFEDWDQKGKS